MNGYPLFRSRGAKIIMNVELLDKTRKIYSLLYHNNNSKVVFNDICAILSDVTASNSYVISRRGKILGLNVLPGRPALLPSGKDAVGSFINTDINDRLLAILSTKENSGAASLGLTEDADPFIPMIILPVIIAGERYGTLLIYRPDGMYGIDDIIVAEYATTVVGLEMTRSTVEEQNQKDMEYALVHAALDSLSHTERDALIAVLEHLPSGKGLIVTNTLSREKGITRSIIVNAVRKMESAGIMQTRSSGVKGTNMQVVNLKLYEELGLEDVLQRIDDQ